MNKTKNILTEKQLEKYPVQVTITRTKYELCKFHSKKIPGCPRPNDGSFSHIVNFALDGVLKKYVPEDYIKSIN